MAHKGKILREIIQEKGLLNKDVAAKIGVSRTYFQHLVSRPNFGPETIQKLCKALKVPESIFFQEVSDNQSLFNGLIEKLAGYDQTLADMEKRLRALENPPKTKKRPS